MTPAGLRPVRRRSQTRHSPVPAPQRVQHVEPPDIAGVKNQIDTAQGLQALSRIRPWVSEMRPIITQSPPGQDKSSVPCL